MKSSASACFLALLAICATYVGADQQALSANTKEPQKAASKQDSVMQAGHAIYVDNCSACHTETGAGLPGLFPPLKGSPAVVAADPSGPIRFVLEGGKSATTGHVPTGAAMPAFGWKLADAEVAAVVTYIRNSWGNEASEVSPTDVHSARQKDCTGLEARLHLQQYFDYFCKR